ncbi:DUF6063 family protein [Bacillus testis]|uniref:DUF6063 family protein n=1 Tax=Bacillus testis TaxID=1622072 RepID=UPI00067F3098|nr:DUF6063 family protein [Bacillus testis]
MEMEAVKRASSIYFALLKNKVIEDTDEMYEHYFEPTTRQLVGVMADESGTQIIETTKRLHLVTSSTGSLFATNFTHLKDKHKNIENKKYFHLVSIIIMAFLSIVDRNRATRIGTEREGISFYALERGVHDLMQKWGVLLKDHPDYGLEKRVDMKEAYDTWMNMEVADYQQFDYKKGNRRSRLGLIKNAMSLLEGEGLVIILDRHDLPKAMPKSELFERIEYLYHDDARYEEMKLLMQTEVQQDA